MRKYIAYTVMIITVLLAGCVRNDNTQPATYNISLETLGANETVDLNRYIERNDQVGDMYNLNRITGYLMQQGMAKETFSSRLIMMMTKKESQP